MKQNTPLDYSDKKIKVYFEIGGSDFIETGYLTNKIDFLNPKDIVRKQYGFELFIVIQQIPEVIEILTKDNYGIYQVIRKSIIEKK